MIWKMPSGLTRLPGEHSPPPPPPHGEQHLSVPLVGLEFCRLPANDDKGLTPGWARVHVGCGSVCRVITFLAPPSTPTPFGAVQSPVYHLV